MSRRARAGRWLAGRPRLAAGIANLPGGPAAVAQVADAEYLEAVLAERVRRGIDQLYCRVCGCRAVLGLNGRLVWAEEMSTPVCAGHVPVQVPTFGLLADLVERAGGNVPEAVDVYEGFAGRPVTAESLEVLTGVGIARYGWSTPRG